MPATVDSLYEQLFPLTTVMKQRFVETFSGSVLDTDRWYVTNTNASVSGMSNEVDGGYYITDTNSYDYTKVSFNDKRQYDGRASKFIYQAKLSNAGATNASGGGLFNLNSDFDLTTSSGYQWEQSANTNYLMCGDGSARSWGTTSGISAGYHTYSAEASLTSVVGSIDGVEVLTRTSNPPQNLPPTSGTGNKLQPMFWHKGTSETFNINYFEAYNT
tara:strand:+ start:705 stop:1352 length:648 start_codon:yes stop_codon:yes gene_type:complete